jgi:hypothetical protein
MEAIIPRFMSLIDVFLDPNRPEEMKGLQPSLSSSIKTMIASPSLDIILI